MDLRIKGIDERVGRRLREQAAAAGMSLQKYVRAELTRIASRPSPNEFTREHPPMSRVELEAIRQRLRGLDTS